MAVVVLAGLVALAVLGLQPGDRSTGSVRKRYVHAAVAANGYECAAIGRSILEKNGSAADAAIATLFCEGLGCAQCMGLGGGFLATVYDTSTGRLRTLNAMERAPAATTHNMFDNASSSVGGLAIAVPGELRGYGELYRQHGRLPWKELVRPAADLCRKGHRVTEYMGRMLRAYSDKIKTEPSLWEFYINPTTNDVYKEGDLLVEPTLARTLDIIAAEGPEAMHNGTLTTPLVNEIKQFGGIIEVDDMSGYKVEWKEPIVTELSDMYTLYTVPLPGSGSLLAFILNMLDGWIGGDLVDIKTGLYWHRVVETFKYAFAMRTSLGDPSRSDLGARIAELERNLSSPDWARSFRNKVDNSRTFCDWRHYGASFGGSNDHGSAHIVVVAPDGSTVSATSSINHVWGSQRRSHNLGMILNNAMDRFAIPNRKLHYSLPPSPANMLGPNLQPLSSMAPSMVRYKNGECDLVIGATGGTKITTQVSLGVIHTILEGNLLLEVMNWPRLHHQLVPMVLEYEADFNEDIIQSLRDRGHVTKKVRKGNIAAMIGMHRENDGYLVPQTDRRRVGGVDGF